MIRVLHKVFDILELLSKDPGKALGLGEIAASTGQKPSACSHILKTMANRSYVIQVAPKKGYVLGPMAYFLTRHGNYRADLVHKLEPVLTELVRVLGDTVVLTSLHEFRKYVLCQVQADSSFRITQESFSDVYSTATGRVLLAYLSDSMREACFLHYGFPGEDWAEVVDFETFELELGRIREQGYVIVSHGESLMLTAVPVWEQGRVACCLGVSCLKHRFSKEHEQEILEQLRRVVKPL